MKLSIRGDLAGGLLGESLPGDVPHAEGTAWSTHRAFHPRSGVVGELQGSHAAPVTLFLPSSSLSFSISLLVVLGGCWAGSPTGMLWGNYGARDLVGCCSWGCSGWVQVDVSMSGTWADP